MRKSEVSNEISVLAFDFFYWFSRFEFCLKDCGYLKNEDPGANAEPGWEKFVRVHRQDYQLSDQAKELLTSPLNRQIVTNNGNLEWRPVGTNYCTSDLEIVVRLIKTVRNNLFHGGKHGGADWDDLPRTELLLSASKSVLDQLAVLGGFFGDYEKAY